jgi:transposase-like protein
VREKPVPPLGDESSTPIQPSCPKCSASNARWLEVTSLTNKIDSFQCVACGFAWNAQPTSPAPIAD